MLQQTEEPAVGAKRRRRAITDGAEDVERAQPLVGRRDKQARGEVEVEPEPRDRRPEVPLARSGHPQPELGRDGVPDTRCYRM